MPKFYCNNEECPQYKVESDVDSSICAYDRKRWNQLTTCQTCLRDLELKKVDTQFPQILKTGMMSREDKVKMLRKRAHDQRIPENKKITEYKQHMDRIKLS